jgi:REP element-mobilizing transposase RayT
MEIKPHTLYHIYNQGNNRQTIFYEERNYLYFLKNARELLHPICDTLAYCLMPNHFHFLIYTNEKSADLVKVGNIEFAAIKNAFRLLQSRYASAINKQEKRTGSLFRQKSKFKEIEVAQGINYPFICFNWLIKWNIGNTLHFLIILVYEMELFAINI